MRKLLLALSLLLACLASAAESPIAPDQRRSVEQTFLTFPEWFLVHSPAEYARYVKQHPAHGFPFLGHVGQIWTGYAAVAEEQVRAKYPGNAGYHVMIGVIGGSTTVEYGLRALYENTLGRISWASASALTPEDEYGARVAQDYVDFIRKEPWYLYDFSAKLKGLWADTPLFGADMLRKLERRYALSTEYLVKAAYGQLIKLGTRAAYEPALMTTQVVADHEPYDLADLPNVKLLRMLDDGRAVLELPRYYDFRLAATKLGLQDVQLRDIAGNSDVILVTVLTRSAETAAPPHSRVLFEQPILTEPGRRRVALVLPVAALSHYLVDAPRQGVEIEHVYDY